MEKEEKLKNDWTENYKNIGSSYKLFIVFYILILKNIILLLKNIYMS